jgi:hypothetical protein
MHSKMLKFSKIKKREKALNINIKKRGKIFKSNSLIILF